ncbi:hypothetical protein Tco_0682228 [Tanacetum coccineum]|uniref:Uncharacterized protein n=1 Tax=Tanacetum coccineum TaxID=301880 RepID=A0ABQ4XQK1_9ASTR
MCYVNIFHVMPRVSALAGCDNNQDDDQEDGQNDEDQDDVNERIDSDNNEESDEESNEESDEEIQGANVEEEELDLSCKVRVGSNGNLLWEASVLLGRKKGGVHGDDVAKTVFRMRNGHVEVYGYAFWVNQCTSGFHGVNEPGGVRVAREDDRGVTEGREDVREVFQQRGSGAKRKLSRCGRNQMGNEPILALPEGADDFVVYYDARSKDLEACLEKGRRLTNRWLSMKKDIASCGSKYLAYSEVEVEYQGSSGLLLQPELPE